MPKRINLPGWPVSIRLVDQKELDEKLGGDSCADAAFDYSDSGAEIWILKTLPITQQRLALAHELQHAMTDFLDVLLRTGAAKLPQ
jgi:hypothetical protein